MDKKIDIIVQHFYGCPNGPKMITNVKVAIKGLEDKINYSEQIVDTSVLARKYKFRGSPTLLIQGEDFEGLKAPENPELACRFYPNGLPSDDDIKEIVFKMIDGQ